MSRFTVEFPDKADQILKQLAEKDKTTKVDILRRALALYDYVHKEAVEKDMKLAIADEGNQVKEVIVFR